MLWITFCVGVLLLLPPHAANPMVKATAANPRPKNFACFTFRKAPTILSIISFAFMLLKSHFEPNETLCPF